jgi:glycosyltransferase involved in cell wall biosynthesis
MLERGGNALIVVSAGGRLVSLLPKSVPHIEMPVHRKNFFTGLLCARKLAAIAMEEGINIIHAHSRVPAWIAFLAGKIAGIKFVCTAHACYSLNCGLWPLKRSSGVICVSEAVRGHLKDWLPRGNVRVVYNALPSVVIPWNGGGNGEKRLLFLGRLTSKKGAEILVKALGRVRRGGWTLDIIGDGPLEREIESLSRELGIEDRVVFHGYREDAPLWISRCDLFLFPSLEEGMGISLAQALAAGVPALASDLAAVREMTGIRKAAPDGLVPAGDVGAWAGAIERALAHGRGPTLPLAVRLPTIAEMAGYVHDFYGEILVQE